jgi:pimeloyl-ACP methyl ester carboxylesterase
MYRTTRRLGQLVRVTTKKGAELTGFYAPADKDGLPTLIYTHGLSGSFDTNFNYNLLDLPEAQAFNILLTTSTGHGNIATTRRGDPPVMRLTGSAFEVFTDCIDDLQAWIDFASAERPGPIVLWGHSLGSSKVTHYLAETGDPRVRALALASPSDVPGGFSDNVGADNVPGFIAMARDYVAAGQPQQLMPDDCVIGLLRQRISAGTVLDRFADDAPADVFDFYGRRSRRAFRDLAKIDRPIFVLYCKTGELVGPRGVEAAIAMIREKAIAAPSVEGLVVGGNHWYVGFEDEAMSGLIRWATTAVPVGNPV